MTREEAKELLPIITAFAEGKIVQYRARYYHGAWQESNTLDFDPQCSMYRVKPEPREWWVNVYPGGLLGTPISTRAAADAGCGDSRIECIHVREVI